MTLDDIQLLIRNVPDFPKPDVMFKDITPLLGNAAAELIEDNRGVVACCAFLIELDFLDGRKRLDGHAVESLLHFHE